MAASSSRRDQQHSHHPAQVSQCLPAHHWNVLYYIYKPHNLHSTLYIVGGFSLKGDPETEIFHSFMMIRRLDVLHCDIWFIRFCLDYQQELLILGNTTGRIFVWDLTTDDPIKLRCIYVAAWRVTPFTSHTHTHTLSRSHALTHPKCNAAIRQVTISKDGT